MAKIHSEDEETQYFWTTDLGLATLLLMGRTLQEMDTKDSNKIAFAFEQDSELPDVVNKYWERQLTVEPQAFYSQLLVLRKRINQELNN